MQSQQMSQRIEDTISQDIDLLASWSNNDRKYIVNELLRFALTQEEDFLKHKASLTAASARPVGGTKSAPASIKPAIEAGPKSDATAAHV
jgi:hypothetical protein